MKDKKIQALLIIVLIGGLSVTSFLWGAVNCEMEEALAVDGAETLREQTRKVLQKLSSAVTGPLSRMDVNAINGEIEKISSEAAEKGKPFDFGIGILNRDGVAIAGRYVVGEFRRDDFSSYRFFRESFKKRKRVQEKIYFQDGAQLLVLCSPLVVKKNVIGAIVLGFQPTEVEKKYGVTPEQFLAVDFNK
jgi:hypothetical protein